MTRQPRATRTVRAIAGIDPSNGAHATPIIDPSGFAYGAVASDERSLAAEQGSLVHDRVKRPTAAAFERASIHQVRAESGLAFGSGTLRPVQDDDLAHDLAAATRMPSAEAATPAAFGMRGDGRVRRAAGLEDGDLLEYLTEARVTGARTQHA